MHKIFAKWWQRYLSHPEAVSLVVIFLVAIAVLKFMGQVLAPIIAGAIIAYLLDEVVKKLEQWHLPHLLAVCIVFVLFLGVLWLLFLWLLPLLWEQLSNLFTEVPGMVNRGQSLLQGLQSRYPEIISATQLSQIAGQLTAYIANYSKEVVAFSFTSIIGIITAVIYLVLVPLLVFFFLRDGKAIVRWLTRFLPSERRVLAKIWREMQVKIGSYIRGKIIEIILAAIATGLAFWLLDLHYAILLGALVGLSVVIPYIGVVIVTVPIVIVAIIQWGLSAHFWYLILVYAIITIIDANILVPFLFAEVMQLHPVAIILAVLIFGGLFGFWGVFFAIPLMTLANVLLKSWPTSKVNG